MHVIETQRLRLRRPTMDDALAIFQGYASQEDVLKFLPFDLHRDISDTRKFLTQIQERVEEGVESPFALTRKKDGCLIGMISVRWHGNRAEMGYALDRRMWGQGYMPEAVEAMVRFAFGREEIYRIQALTMPTNRASQRVLKKCGFQREGTLRHYQYIAKLGQPMDMVIWARVRGEGVIGNS